MDSKCKKYIENKLMRNGYTSDYNFTLNEYRDIVSGFGYCLKFKHRYSCADNLLSANAGIFNNSPIVASPEWGYVLITDNENSDLPFRATIGHELGHKTIQLPWRFYFRSVEFSAWVSEVACDFYGMKLMNLSKEDMINAFNYKINKKRENEVIDESNYSHPKLSMRVEYIMYYDFDKRLIKRIFDDSGCKNINLLNDVISYYEKRA